MRFRRKSREEKMKSEIQFHLDQATLEYRERGLDEKEARRRALLDFGSTAQIEEDLRDIQRPRWLADLVQDLVYAARTFRRSPAFLACAVATLALGIGANTAIFSLMNAVLLRPMGGVADPARLVQLARQTPNCEACAVSYPLFEYFRGGLGSISGAFAVMTVRHDIAANGVEEPANGDLVTGDYYRVLGLAPAAGRLLTAEDDARPTPVAVISHDYWQRRFGLAPAAIGRTITYGSTALTIVGVEPETFEGTERGRRRDFVAPLSMVETLNGGRVEWRQGWDFNGLSSMARLRPGVSIEQASAEANARFAVWQREKIKTLTEFQRARFAKERGRVLPAAAGTNGLRGRFLKPLTILAAIVALVLLLACANLSGLLLARASAREREIAVRRALGAGRGRLTRQFLAESLLLASCGGVAGLFLAMWLSRSLVAMMANGGRLELNTSPDWRVFVFAGLVALTGCVLSGIAPGWMAARNSLQRTVGPARPLLGRVLVVAQVAISMTLLVGASLFLRTLVKLSTIDTGIQTGGVLTFSITQRDRLREERGLQLQAAIVERLRSLPGVVSAAAADMLPLDGGLWSKSVKVEGYTFGPGEDEDAAFNAVSPGFFAVTGTPLLAGRDFDGRDEATAPPVALVNEAFVRSLFGGRSPIGKHITTGRRTYEVVGVVKDARYENLRKPAPRTVYVPWMQTGDVETRRAQPSARWYLVRTAGVPPERLAPAIERAVPELDASLRVRDARTYAETVSHLTLNERMMAILGGFFGALALIVACLGIFGITAFQVSRRVSEIGVRMALGATRASVIRMVLGGVARMLGMGCLVGGLVAFAVAPLLRGFLFGITPTDPAAFLLAAVALVLSTLLAGLLPALRASRVDPMIALRCE